MYNKTTKDIEADIESAYKYAEKLREDWWNIKNSSLDILIHYRTEEEYIVDAWFDAIFTISNHDYFEEAVRIDELYHRVITAIKAKGGVNA